MIGKAMEVSDRVHVMLGSANVARDTRNPFTYEERRDVLEACLRERWSPGEMSRISFAPLNDRPYDKAGWIDSVNASVRGATNALRPRVSLVGNIRDATSEYLTWFRAWDYVPVPDSGTNATAIRKAYFTGAVDFDSKGWNDGFDWSTVPRPTIEFLRKFRDRPVYAYLMKQLAAEIAYREKWGDGPHQTVDPVILAGDQIAMITRGGEEGTGMKGLPGGFLNAYERTLDGAAREGVEETGIFIEDRDLPAFQAYLGECHEARVANRPAPPAPGFLTEAITLLKSFHQGEGHRFDDPNRSRRGHLITEAHLFQIPKGYGLPRLIGMDDAKAAFWMPTFDLDPTDTFEDHAHIADFMIGRYASF
ncbi:cytidyltransferase [Caulobacter phage CcrBL9]|uniref:Nicotinamide-nucleotide adenylyltransferase n=1 Tax=Caulobacter phage CcrBL9 TaxID=2283270 RepID=A0A385EEZ0_9CAUD|nr:cytidyltransferase [Caulobacter phage CcrBL9]AXQ69259.1 nicotinamide-nucleotide adenylyltransferase [Caulobacter phage CcrBL9]